MDVCATVFQQRFLYLFIHACAHTRASFPLLCPFSALLCSALLFLSVSSTGSTDSPFLPNPTPTNCPPRIPHPPTPTHPHKRTQRAVLPPVGRVHVGGDDGLAVGDHHDAAAHGAGGQLHHAGGCLWGLGVCLSGGVGG
jgi:hypothetical protein